MITATSVKTNFNTIVKSYGDVFRIKIYSQTLNAGSYDDFRVLAQSGNSLWISGLIMPLGHPTKSSSEAVLMEQGKLLASDSILYFDSIYPTSGVAVKIGLGSPIEEEYYQLQQGTDEWSLQSTSVYKKIYLRVLPNGSFIGE